MVWEEAGRSSEGNSMNKWQQEIPTGPIQLAFGNCFDPMVIFFLVASSHWILLVSVRMQNYEMLSCVILLPWISQWSNWKSICRIAGTRDADVTLHPAFECLWEVLMKRLWNMWYQLLYNFAQDSSLFVAWYAFCLWDFGHRPPLRIWQRCSLHFVCVNVPRWLLWCWWGIFGL